MNNWKIIGYIFVAIGIVVLLYGIFVTTMLASALSGFGYPMQLPAILYMSIMAPYLAAAAVFFIIGIIGLYAGRTPKNQTTESQI